MKTLQNNFTNPEQSRLLLELGVLADSADCFYYDEYKYKPNAEAGSIHLSIHIRESQFDLSQSFFNDDFYIPCWSVGQLLYICKKCEPKKDYEQLCDEMKYCSDFCVLIISHIIANLPIIDFLKLEE